MRGDALPSLTDVREAARRLEGLVERTPLARLPDAPGGIELLLKLENRQLTSSFKARGAQHRALRAGEEGALTGLITYSSGNHGQATALAAQRMGLSCTVVAPEDVSPVKRQAMEQRGARVVLHGRTSRERQERAEALAGEQGLTVVPPYDDPDVVAGQGTVGLEIHEQAHELALVVVPMGGGGLVAGVATALSALRPGLAIWGVEPEDADDARRSLAAGRRLSNEAPSTSACDGLRNTSLGELNWRVVRERVTGIVAVPDREVLAAVALLHERGLGPVEPSGAAATAAVLFGRLPLPEGPVACVVSGGNAEAV